ncbi:hypothetical protein OPT61_g5334 [Boeremia exigua]|uniref:Uncharacterized protein n=1 Tax=Boeremia exigua TaxID=749465 RepID=A0ACC2IAY6_9PLEO|nr:hypothetical protein OPT61_g5334 [Boeremia exigua]
MCGFVLQQTDLDCTTLSSSSSTAPGSGQQEGKADFNGDAPQSPREARVSAVPWPELNSAKRRSPVLHLRRDFGRFAVARNAALTSIAACTRVLQAELCNTGGAPMWTDAKPLLGPLFCGGTALCRALQPYSSRTAGESAPLRADFGRLRWPPETLSQYRGRADPGAAQANRRLYLDARLRATPSPPQIPFHARCALTSDTFLKRKGGLFKKAHELSVLCSVDVAVIIFGHNKKLYEFSSGDINETIGRYQYYGGAHEHKGPEDFMGKKDDEDEDEDEDGAPPGDSHTPPEQHGLMPHHMQHAQAFQHVPPRALPAASAPPVAAEFAVGPASRPRPPQLESRPSPAVPFASTAATA